MKSLRSKTAPPSLGAVITAYQQLVDQWSALLTMIQSFPQDGWLVSLTPSDAIPKLLVSRVPRLLPPTGGSTGPYSETVFSTSYTPASSWTLTPFPGTSVGQGLPLPTLPTKTVPMKVPLTSSKRATCPSERRRSRP